MEQQNLVFDESTGLYTDKYNGVKYVKLGENLAPLIAGGLPAELQVHNGKNYMVNYQGTYAVGDDGKVSTDRLKSNLDGSSLFFTQDGKLESKYSNCKYELVNGKPVALYDTEHNIPAAIEEREGTYRLVSEQGTYDIDENGVAMTPKELLFKTIKAVEAEFFADPERTEEFLEANPEKRKEMLDDFKRERGITPEMQSKAMDGQIGPIKGDDEMIRKINAIVNNRLKPGSIPEMLEQLRKGLQGEVEQTIETQEDRDAEEK